MSVIVKEINMPTGCNNTCPCRDAETGFCEAGYIIYGDYKHINEDYYSRPNNCPLADIKNYIPFLLHQELDCPLDECVNAYNVAINYLRSKSRVKG